MQRCFIAGDVEMSVGISVPTQSNMVSFAMCEIGNPSEFFYAELSLVHPQHWDPATEPIHRITREYLRRNGVEPRLVMRAAEQWVKSVARGREAVYCAMPISVDYVYMDWYFQYCGIPNPFSEALDGRAQYRVIHGLSPDTRVNREDVWAEFPTGVPHTHHALSDTFEYEEVAAGMLRRQGLLR